MIQTDVLVSDIEPVGPFVRVVLRSPGARPAPSSNRRKPPRRL